MSLCRQQVLIEAPIASVWELVSNPRRYPEWWPRVVDVRSDAIYIGSIYRQVTATTLGKIETGIRVERLEGLRQLHLRCMDTGMFSRWLLTDTRHGTFLDVEFGMDPQGVTNRAFDVIAGRRYFRRWLDQSIDALRAAVGEERDSSGART